MTVSPTPARIISKKGTAITDGIAAYEGAQKLFDSGKVFWRRHFAYTVTVSEKDILYSDVHAWLMSIMPDERHHSLRVSSSKDVNNSDPTPVGEDGSDNTKPKPLIIRFDDSTERSVNIDGHQIRVAVKNPEVATTQFVEPRSAKIEFVARTYTGQQAIVEHLQRLNDERSTSRKAVLRMVNQWGSWRVRSDIPPRSLDSVAIPYDQKHRVWSDLEEFLCSEEKYNRLAIPWHRGYMFHGPPGTGKTSLVKALSNHFNLDLWYISLSDLKSESGLLGLLADVGPRSLLLLEDMDIIKITQDRNASDPGTISMSSLLNTLDGVATPHGLITIMTTNRLEVLDSALTRAGRMDLIEEIGYPTRETLAALYHHFYGTYPDWPQTDEVLSGLSTAMVAEIFKKNMDDPAEAEKKILMILDT